MIKITKNEDDVAICRCCKAKNDLYNVDFGRNEDSTLRVVLCPACRKQLSNMLTKRVK